MKIERKVSIERLLRRGKRRFDIGINLFYNGIIIANCAGSLEDLNGIDNRYKQIARYVQEKGVGTFVRMGNELPPDLIWPASALDDFRYLVDYCKKNGEQLSGKINPLIFLMGYSAGAGIAAIVGGEFSVERLLLIAPGVDCGCKRIRRNIESYLGELYLVIGKNDHTVGPKTGESFYKWAIKASKRVLREIPQCTHDFEGETNSRILSKAPLWAFAGDETFPSPEGGIIMYDKGKGPFVPTSYHIDPVTRELIEHEK